MGKPWGRVVLKTKNDKTLKFLKVGVEYLCCFNITKAKRKAISKELQHYNRESFEMRVLIWCSDHDNADVRFIDPLDCKVKIFKNGRSNDFLFGITPKKIGPLDLKIMLYEWRTSFLIQEYTASMPVVA